MAVVSRCGGVCFFLWGGWQVRDASHAVETGRKVLMWRGACLLNMSFRMLGRKLGRRVRIAIGSGWIFTGGERSVDCCWTHSITSIAIVCVR